MSDPPDAASRSRQVRSYHAHIYFRDERERARALTVREAISQRFWVQLGRVHDALVGPHRAPMDQVAFERASFAELVPWLMLHREDLSVLVHPNTGRARDDHQLHALWLGTPLGVRGEALSNEPCSSEVARIEPNTTPSLSPE